jgi:hypothetical protein
MVPTRRSKITGREITRILGCIYLVIHLEAILRAKDGAELLRVFRTDCVRGLIVAAQTKEDACNLVRRDTNYFASDEEITLIGIKGMGYAGASKVFCV